MRAAALALAGLLACATGGVAGPPASAARTAARPATVKVAIDGMHFLPADAAVKPGDTIVWTNKDIVAHTVTSTTGAFDSKLIAPGGTWKYVVRKKGAFAYHCSYHPPMTATITVR